MVIKFGDLILFENTKEVRIKVIAFYFILYPLMLICKEHTNIWYFLFGIPFAFIIFLCTYKNNIDTNKVVKVVGILMLFGILSLLTGYLGNYIYNWIGMCSILFIYCLPWMLLTIVNNEWEMFAKIICSKTVWMFVSTLILYLHDVRLGVSMNGNMQFSYAAMPVVIFALYDFFERKSLYQLIISITLFIMIVLFGSRGPLACIAIFLILYFLKNRRKHLPLIVLFSLPLLYLVNNFEQILGGIVTILERKSISSRTIYKLMSGTIASTTGRDAIQDVVIRLIGNRFVTGVGIGGERIAINKEIYNFTKNMGSCYPHNILLEVIVQYGVVIGGFLIAWFIIRCIKTYKYSNKKDALIFFISISIVHLMLSSSYLEDPMFFAMLGMLMNNENLNADNKSADEMSERPMEESENI